jgi:hypothetical protein
MSAFWISPYNIVYAVKIKHINFILDNFDMFFKKRTKENYAIPLFKKYNEPIGFEGKARKELFLEGFSKGWIRVREKKDYYLFQSINHWFVEERILDFVFSKKLFEKNIKILDEKGNELYYNKGKEYINNYIEKIENTYKKED